MPIPKACVHTAISTDTAMDTDTAMMESEATTHEHERVGPTRAKKRRRRGPPRHGLGRVGAAVRRRLGLRVALLCHTPVNNLVAQQANVDCYVRARLRARTLDLATIVDTAGRLKVETLDRILHVASGGTTRPSSRWSSGCWTCDTAQRTRGSLTLAGTF